jgi:hypothetical protein
VWQQLFGGGTGGSTNVTSSIYADHKPIAQAGGQQQASLKKLTLLGGTPQGNYGLRSSVCLEKGGT